MQTTHNINNKTLTVAQVRAKFKQIKDNTVLKGETIHYTCNPLMLNSCLHSSTDKNKSEYLFANNNIRILHNDNTNKDYFNEKVFITKITAINDYFETSDPLSYTEQQGTIHLSNGDTIPFNRQTMLFYNYINS